MALIVQFKTAHWKRDARSHWNRKVASSQACQRLRTIESQDDCIGWNPDVSFTHMDASGVNDVMKFVHRLLRAIVKVAVLNDTPGSVEALVGPNSYRGVKKRFDCFYFTLLFFTTKLYSTMRSPLRCLVAPWGSAPRIFTSSF